MTSCALIALAVGVGCGGDRGGGASGDTGLTTTTSATATATATATDSSGTSDSSGTDSASGGGEKFDVGTSDLPGGVCPDGGGGGGGMGDTKFSYIWIANSLEGTVSKINTETAVEEARYATGPGAPQVSDPSRTSVNLLGDVAVVDRNGAIIKIAVLEDRCVDLNANGTIETSTGPGNVLPWGQDECVLWRTELPAMGSSGPRPVAWEGGDEMGCAIQKPRVWVGYYTGTNGEFRRLDGSSGAIVDSVTVPWNGGNWGPYGGATNQAGDFWVVGHSNGPLVKIDAVTLQYETWDIPSPQGSYGMALDANGHPWVASLSNAVFHFNPDTQQWTTINTTATGRGLMVDKEGIAWVAANNPGGLMAIDTKTETVVAPMLNIGASQPVGISIDVEGYVWVVDQSANAAFKVDPISYQVVATATGLVGPYTYSDMTGAGLDLVFNPPQG